MTLSIPAATEFLDSVLQAATDEGTRRHWEQYLKGTARFRGVPMAGVRRAVDAVWREWASGWSAEEGLTLATAWFARPCSEDKLAAVLLIAEHLAPLLSDGDHVSLASPLQAGDISDWNVCDWYATKALHAYLTVGGRLEPRARHLAAWGHSAGLWQRRAGLVAFVKLAAAADRQFPGFVPLVVDACAGNLVSSERVAHTGPGWVLRELSRTMPQAVAAFLEEHPELSPEGRRMATARLRPGPYRRR